MEMKECPFCEAESRVAPCTQDGVDIFVPLCTICGAMIKPWPKRFTTEAAAVAAWNKRAGWVNVSERLPEHGERVLASWKCGECDPAVGQVLYSDIEGWILIGFTSHPMQFVTHWMKLPEPPEDGR